MHFVEKGEEEAPGASPLVAADGCLILWKEPTIQAIMEGDLGLTESGQELMQVLRQWHAKLAKSRGLPGRFAPH